MGVSIHVFAAETFVAMLRDLTAVLEKGAAHAKAAGLDLVNARLAPDMFTLAMQVRIACDHADGAMRRLTGGEPVESAEADASFEAMTARIAATIAFVESAKPVAGAEERDFEIPLIDKLALHVDGTHLIQSWHLPNFYFHVVTAYDILRANGVVLGKRDYMAHIAPYIRSK
jgi:hypothetical protein